MKRILDILISIFGLLILSPLFLFTALIIWLEDKGQIIYRASRIGLYGVPFIMYKFRTMVVDAEKLGPPSTSADDKRITKTGGFLRRYKIDEIPQLINVLIGDMSIVGPRPEVKKFTDLYTDEEKAILNVRPGITDWASIWNSDEAKILEGAADPDKTYLEQIRPYKIRLQLKYVYNHNFFIDLKIIIKTVIRIFFGKRY